MGQNRCDKVVKDVVKSFHTKCDHKRALVEVFGQYLNAALGTIDSKRNKKYCICQSLYQSKIKTTMEKLVQE